jgi:hypothetical protein
MLSKKMFARREKNQKLFLLGSLLVLCDICDIIAAAPQLQINNANVNEIVNEIK